MEKRTALVTGASRGLGAEFTRQLAAKGYALILVSRVGEDLQRLAQSITAEHDVAVIVKVVDLLDAASLQALLDWLADQPVDLLVNNAGFGTIGLFADNAIEKSMGMVNLQVEALTRLTHAVLPGMIARDRGDIINVSSMIAHMTQRYNAMFAATKYFINGFSACLRKELWGTAVHVQTLLPGLTRTDFYDTEELAPARLSVKIPEKYWMMPDTVVHCSLTALRRHKGVVVPGVKNKFILLYYQLQDMLSVFLPGKKRNPV